jgi:hypothetical protein
MNTYIIGFRQKSNPNGKVIREQKVEAISAAKAIEGTYSDRVARSETWKTISKQDENGFFQLITTIDQYRAAAGEMDLDIV